jgi:putative transposase
LILFPIYASVNFMKLIAQLKLQPTPAQQSLLKATLEIANAACNAISEYAWENKAFSKYPLQKALYQDLRKQFKLTAQMVIRCLSKVADAYKLDTNAKRCFNEHGGIAYDSRILTYFTKKQGVSIWTLTGREKMSYVCGDQQKEMLEHQRGESDLVYLKGNWYLLATCEIDEPTPEETERWLGVDRGVVNVAADSEGQLYTGEEMEAKRVASVKQTRALQRIGTKSARRCLKRLAGKQKRYQKDVNHCISKQLVLKAKRTKQGIAVEDLTGINLRTRVRHEDRAQRGNWSFDQLGSFIEYKARKYGVQYREVDPHYTSQRCAACKHTEKANRRSQANFLCRSCGHFAHADVNAAVNIALQASVNTPYVSTPTSPKKAERASGTSPSL